LQVLEMNDDENVGRALLDTVASTRSAIEANEFMNLLTSLTSRGRYGHAAKHKSGMAGLDRRCAMVNCTERSVGGLTNSQLC
jgi:hypothetical protein